MHLIATTEQVVLNTDQFFRVYPSAVNGTADLDRVWIHLSGEGRLINEELARKTTECEDGEDQGSQGEQESSANKTKAVTVSALAEDSMLDWPHCPARLGRVSSQLVGDGLHTHEELLVLPAQLAALRARKPHKQHFRFAVVHGFGSGLGDSLVGMTAFRCVAEVLGQQLPGFAVDILLAPDINTVNADLVGDAPWVDRVLFQGPSMQDFAQYDGYFDVSELLILPKYYEIPIVDWYLWWFGLDPQAIAPSAKRNRGSLRLDAWNTVREVLRHTPDQKILFNPKASAKLRSMPPEVASQFAQRLLELDKNLHLVIDQPLDLKHERLWDVSAHINSPEKFKALVAQVDGLITVDTFSLHWADVCQTPCATLLSAIEPDSYPYYPFNTGTAIDYFRGLPGYKKVKESEEDWPSMEASYHAAWKLVSADKVLDLLRINMAKKQALSAGKKKGLSLISAPRVASCIRWDAKTFAPQLKRQRTPTHIALTQERLGQLAQSLLKPGTTAVLAAPTSPTLAVQVAQRVQALGAVHIFEPRPVLAQLLGGALVGAGVFNAQVHLTLPLGGITEADFPDLDPWSESVVAEWGNSLRNVKTTLQPIDNLQLQHCHALIIEPPMPFALVIEGALETLKRCRPVILMAPISQEDMDAVCQIALAADYTFCSEALLSVQGVLETQGMLLLGVPAESEQKIDGFNRVNL